MSRVYDSQKREWVEAVYDAVTNKYWKAGDNSRSLGTRESKCAYGTAIRKSDVVYDYITNKYYRKRDGKSVTDGSRD